MRDDLRRFLAKATGPQSERAAAAQQSVADARAALAQAHAGEHAPEPAPAPRWELAALRGRLVELSAHGASATLTAAIELVAQAQRDDDVAAWIQCGDAPFFPPDAAAGGVDLRSLAVIRAKTGVACARAATRLLGSGAFGLVVLDLGATDLAMAAQGRLVTLAQTHDAAIVCLTEKPNEAPSLGSLVSLRATALRGARPDYAVTIRALKDKRRGPGWSHVLATKRLSGASAR